MMGVSILITTYNRSNLLFWGLKSLIKQDISRPYEILVMNDGFPDDGTEEVCEKFKNTLPIQYIFTGKRNTIKGAVPINNWRVPGFAFNIGVKRSKYPIIILSCAEIFHIKSCNVENLSKPLKSNKKLMTICESQREGDKNFLDILESSNGLYKDEQISKQKKIVNTRLPFCMGLSKQTFMEIGGYDEDLIGVAYDDNDLVYRLTSYGCLYETVEASFIHLWHKRLDKKTDSVIRKKMILNRNIYKKKQIENPIIRNKTRVWGIL